MVNVMYEVQCLKVEAWPEADRKCWLRALEPHNPFKRGVGAAARFAPSTQAMIANGYGRYLSWLAEAGRLDPGAGPADRVSEHNLIDYLDHLKSRYSSFTAATRVQQLGNAVRVMAPDADFAMILRASYRVRSDAQPTRNKRDRVQPCDRTTALGLRLLNDAKANKFLTRLMRAKLFRDGLLILFLAYRANRIANLASIEVGKQLVLRGSTLWLCFDTHEMKGRRDFETPMPNTLVPHILTYLEEYRPILLASTRKNLPPTNGMWISSQGTVMTASAIGIRVRARTEAAFGNSMSPHFFRDSLATTKADESPEDFADTAALLGHRSLDVAEKHYNQSNGIKARSRYAEAISHRYSDEPD